MIAKPEHEIAYQEIQALFARHAATMTPVELLAMAANLVGKIIAYQDQRVTLAIVGKNIEIGYAHALAELSKTKGSA